MSGPIDGGGLRVAVRRDELDGTIIEAGPDSVLGLQPVEPVEGLQVWVDPLDPARLVRLTVAEITESDWLLDEVLGNGASAAIVAARTADGVATVRPTQAMRDAGRLGLLLWLEDCSPLALDQGLLDAEIALAMRAFPVGADRQARARAAMPAVLNLAHELADGTVQPPPMLARAAFGVAGALLGSGSPDEEQTRALIRLAGAARSAGAAIAGPVDIDIELLALFDSAVAAAHWEATWAPTTAVEMRFSVDWRLVPRGVLDSREGTIRVTRDVGQTGLPVTVVAIPGTPEVPLFARILRRDSNESVAVAPLRLDAVTASYRAVLPADELSDGDRVDVFSASSTVAPLRGRLAEQQAAALRCAARGFSAMRLATAAPDRSPALWRSSADEWTEWLTEHATANEATAERDRDVVLAALARCQGRFGSPAASRTLARRTDPRTEPSWADPTLDLSLAEGRLLGLV